jgi:hypothetical protein
MKISFHEVWTNKFVHLSDPNVFYFDAIFYYKHHSINIFKNYSHHSATFTMCYLSKSPLPRVSLLNPPKIIFSYKQPGTYALEYYPHEKVVIKDERRIEIGNG